MTPAIEVVRPGALTTVQDLGRPGFAHLGVPRSGAADRASLRLANRLVGNPDSAPALETTLVGPTLRFARAATIALTGATVDARLDDHAVAMNAALDVAAGATLRVGTARSGLRTYIAVHGGISVPAVLGSASTDVLSGLGPKPLAAGTTLAVGTLAQARVEVGVVAVRAVAAEPTLRIVPGPRDDWFTAAALATLTHGPYVVSADSNRTGVRLTGPDLRRTRDGELASEGMVPGALQVPPSGQPILLLADHPTTGGYPVIAVVGSDDLPIAGQLRPGQSVRFAIAPSDHSGTEAGALPFGA